MAKKLDKKQKEQTSKLRGTKLRHTISECMKMASRRGDKGALANLMRIGVVRDIAHGALLQDDGSVIVEPTIGEIEGVEHTKLDRDVGKDTPPKGKVPTKKGPDGWAV